MVALIIINIVIYCYCIFSKFLKKDMYPNSYISAMVIDISDDLFSTEFQILNAFFSKQNFIYSVTSIRYLINAFKFGLL